MSDNLPVYTDIAAIPEDDRIRMIGEQAQSGRVVSFITDEEDGKLDRYLFKLFTQYPNLVLVQKGLGPTPGCVWAKVMKV